MAETMNVLTTGRPLTLLRVVFTAAMVAAFVVAISPLAIESGVDNGDKVAHVLAFYGLTILAAVSFPKSNIVIIAIGMSAFGALIEIVQGLSFIGRDRDVLDWIADTAAVIAALAPLYVAPWRTRLA
jgi:VanZ family protein